MALVDLHFNRCKGRPNWRIRNSLKQNDVASVLKWEKRKKGKHISRKVSGVVHDENQETTIFVSAEGTRVRVSDFQGENRRATCSLGFCTQKTVAPTRF
jgi:hypothetical protein